MGGGGIHIHGHVAQGWQAYSCPLPFSPSGEVLGYPQFMVQPRIMGVVVGAVHKLLERGMDSHAHVMWNTCCWDGVRVYTAECIRSIVTPVVVVPHHASHQLPTVRAMYVAEDKSPKDMTCVIPEKGPNPSPADWEEHHGPAFGGVGHS